MALAGVDPDLLHAIADQLGHRLGVPVDVASLGGEGVPDTLLIRLGGVAHLLAPRPLHTADGVEASGGQDEALSGRPAPIVLAPSIPAAVRAALRDRGIAHADRAGTVWLRLPGLVADLDPRPGEAPARRRGRPRRDGAGAPAEESARPYVNTFTEAGGLVLRALLRDPARAWSQQELADETKLSKGIISDIIRTLSHIHHISESREGRRTRVRPADPARLLLDWSGKVERPGPARYAFYVDAPLEARERLLAAAFGDGDLADRWALTLHAAGRHLAPHVVQDQLHAYVAADRIDAAAARLENDFFLARVGRAQQAQANLHLLAPHDARGTFVDARTVDGVRIVSPVQLFLDLAHWPVRGAEAISALVRGPLGHQLHLDADARRRLLARFA